MGTLLNPDHRRFVREDRIVIHEEKLLTDTLYRCREADMMASCFEVYSFHVRIAENYFLEFNYVQYPALHSSHTWYCQ